MLVRLINVEKFAELSQVDPQILRKQIRTGKIKTLLIGDKIPVHKYNYDPYGFVDESSTGNCAIRSISCYQIMQFYFMEQELDIKNIQCQKLKTFRILNWAIIRVQK